MKLITESLQEKEFFFSIQSNMKKPHWINANTSVLVYMNIIIIFFNGYIMQVYEPLTVDEIKKKRIIIYRLQESLSSV